MRKEKGFSLIELLIVVAIILIIAAIAVPNLLRSRMAANESSAAASLRTIATANVTYSSTYNVGYAGALTAMAPSTSPSSSAADLLDSVLSLATPVKSGYTFTYSAQVGAPTPAAPNPGFAVVATPVGPGSSGTSTFCTDQTNVVGRDNDGSSTTPAAASSCGFGTGTFNPL
jgi:prepilin-type N-terminal cleavage/methylation domain-containing protein